MTNHVNEPRPPGLWYWAVVYAVVLPAAIAFDLFLWAIPIAIFIVPASIFFSIDTWTGFVLALIVFVGGWAAFRKITGEWPWPDGKWPKG